MQSYRRYWVYILVVSWAIGSIKPNALRAQILELDSWKTDLECKTHFFVDPDDPSDYQEILEFSDSSGIPVGFAKEIDKIVCLTGNCRKLELWLLWDGLGNYLGFELIENTPLTKTDHLEFSQEDYKKLHQLLSDKESVLRNMEQEALLFRSDEPVGEVDGYSGATKLSLREYLVEGAAYTCFVLWHTVYGPNQDIIENIMEEKGNTAFLTLLFEQREPSYKIWAISFIQRNPDYFPYFNEVIMEQIKSNDEKLSSAAMASYGPDKLHSTEIQLALVSSIDQFPDQRKYELLWKLEELEQVEDETIQVLLDQFAIEKINTSLIGYVYGLIQSENLENPQIDNRVKSLRSHKNWYVRNLTDKLLTEGRNKKN
jgi:hypothetical protein